MFALVTAYLTAVAAALRATLTRAWWEEFAEAAWRQAQQYVGPFLLVVIGTGQFDSNAAATVAVALAGSVLVVFGRRVLAIQAPAGSGPGVALTFRVLSAFAGAVAGFAAVDGFNLLTADWPAVLTASAATAGLAFLGGKVDPAASAVRADTLTVEYGTPVTAVVTGIEFDATDRPADRGADRTDG